MNRLLVLDLDETLFHAYYLSELEDDQNPEDFEYCILNEFPATTRPHLDEFLQWASDNFTIGVWTSASQDYADDVVERLFIKPGHKAPLFVYAQDRCVKAVECIEPWGSSEYIYLKDLTKLDKFGFSLDDTIVVDDTPSKLRRQYGNLVRIRPYIDDSDDTELLKLKKYLEYLKDVPNIRQLEKRGWENKYK